MGDCIEIKGFTKRYRSFTLDNVSVSVPYGTVLGLVGENGAGKTTMLKGILGLIAPSEGEIKVFGESSQELSEEKKEKIGVVFDVPPFPPSLNAVQTDKVMSGIFRTWDSEKFFGLLKRFELPANKKLKSFSRGMGMRFSIAAALAHNPELLVLDEPTGGLDPVVRNEMIDIFREFMLDENHTIVISTHITSDLDQLADYICFVEKGKIIFNEDRNELFDKYRILKCSEEQTAMIDKEDIKGIRRCRFSAEVMVINAEKYSDIPSDVPTLDEIMVFHTIGEAQKTKIGGKA